ncbi:TPA: catalase, partial [Serratia marcescens]|nr:catalase [Serratia marcescens]
DGAAAHWNHREDTDYYSQPRALFNLLSEEEHQRIYTRIAAELSQVPEDIQKRALHHFEQIHPDYSEGIIHALNRIK